MIKAIVFDCFGVVLTVQDIRIDVMIDFIKTLKPAYKVGMVSNVIGRETIERRFVSGELDSLFDTIIASGEVGFEKPDHRIFDLAAKQLGVLPEECLFIDDIQEYCDAAARIGMKAIRCVDVTVCIEEIQAVIDSQRERY